LKPWYSGWVQTFVPIFGDEFMPISVNRAVKEGNFCKDIKLLIGHNEMEGALLIASFDILRGLLGRYLPPLPISPLISKRRVYFDIKNIFIDNDTIGIPIAEKFLEHYSENSYILNQNSIRKSAVHLFGNYLLTCPTILFGGHIVKNSLFTGKVFQYRLTHVITQSISKLSIWAEATHADDLPLLFGQPFKPIEWRFWSSSDRKLSKEIMDIWTHFAKYESVFGLKNIYSLLKKFFFQFQ
jgi:carboxylesterase type B